MSALNFERSDRGASAVEYGLLITGIAAVIAAAVFLLGGGVNGLFETTCSSISQHANGTNC